jgi:hypothetical protein
MTELELNTCQDICESFVEKWGSPVVLRTEVGVFSGGLLHPRTLANLDSLGEGPLKITCGRKVAYRAVDLADWLRGKIKYGK